MSPNGNKPESDGGARPAIDTAFHVDCACGNRISVTEGQAGLRLTCSCGLPLQVPNLHELRMQAGLPPFPVRTANQVEELVRLGKLPAGTTCARCSRPTATVLHALAACEFLWITTEQRSVFGVVVSESEVSEHGNNLVVPVPILLCPDCQRAVFRFSFFEKYRPAAIPLALAGGASLLFKLWLIPLILLPLAGLLFVAPDLIAGMQQRVLKRLVRRTPLYDQLLAEYPDTIVFALKNKVPGTDSV